MQSRISEVLRFNKKGEHIVPLFLQSISVFSPKSLLGL